MASLLLRLRTITRSVRRAYRRVPVRWRLGGGSAALTLVILAGFAVATDVLIDRHLSSSFSQAQTGAMQQAAAETDPTGRWPHVSCNAAIYFYGKDAGAQIRLFTRHGGKLLCSSELNVDGRPVNTPFFRTSAHADQTYTDASYRIATQSISWKPHQTGLILYALPLSNLQQTLREVRVFLIGGVLGGAILAMLAGLLVAQRAMSPVVELTDAAREIERTRDATVRIPHPEAEDEVAELARTLESMLAALAAARNESETALARQREFVADASHELRTPLTSVLANLELLADELHGEQAESANAALRSTRRMRRLVADLLLLARADVGRFQTRRPADLAQSLMDAAAELTPALSEHDLTVSAQSAAVEGITDDLHRLILNLIENAINHTPPGTHVFAATSVKGGRPTVTVADDGPGIPPEFQKRVFERFVRGGGDAGTGARGTGLGLSIVRAVADVHNATILLESLPEIQGTRFTISFPALAGEASEEELTNTVGGQTQTSTTTGRTIGRRRNRS
ncbi:MAG: sensor histidine kinase [Solirubrobacteraceae bacterium]